MRQLRLWTPKGSRLPWLVLPTRTWLLAWPWSFQCFWPPRLTVKLEDLFVLLVSFHKKRNHPNFKLFVFWQVHYGCPIRLSRWQAGCLKLVTPHSPSIIATSMALLLMLLWSLPMSCPDLRSWLCKLLNLMTKQAILPCIKQIQIPRKFKPAILPSPPMTSIIMGWTKTCLLLLCLLLRSRRQQERKAQCQQLQNKNSRSQQGIFQ